MISQSSAWKEPLLKSADYLAKVRFGERTTDRTLVRVEKELFIGFYSIRRLLEGFLVSDATRAQRFKLEWYPARRRVDLLNSDKLDLNYDLSSTQVEERDLEFLCNQFIHSFVFMVSQENSRLGGAFVASDRARHQRCYFVDRRQILTAFRTVGKDYPANLTLARLPESGQWVGRAW